MTYVNKYKEVNKLPRMDGTGPMGCGPRTGWGNGACRHGATTAPRGFGMRRGMGFSPNAPQNSRETLNMEEAILQERLANVDKQLETL